MSTNLMSFTYKGKVDVNLRIKDKVIHLTQLNHGLPSLSMSFCKFVTGNTLTQEDYPCFLDLRKSNTEEGTYNTNLLSKIPLSGKTWSFNTTENNYVATFNAVISFNNLQQAIVRTDSNYYRLYLCSGMSSTQSGVYYDLAYLDVTAEALSYISPGTQAEIEWSMQLLNVS